MKHYDVTELTSLEMSKLPQYYISFNAVLPLDELVGRMEKLEEKLHTRHLDIVKPYVIFKIKFQSETDRPYYQYAFELKRVNQ